VDVAPITVHGWEFQLVDQGLLITSEQDSQIHLELSARATYSLLDYLYQYRNALHDAAVAEEEHEVNATTPNSMHNSSPGRESEEVS
jgi:hypothetical protein